MKSVESRVFPLNEGTRCMIAVAPYSWRKGPARTARTSVTAGQRLALGDRQGLLAVVAEGHAELAAVLQKASEEIETTYPTPPEFVAQGDRVLVVGVAAGKIKSTNKPFKDDWVFDITVRNGKLTKIREYIDTQALARASQRDASGPA